MKTSLCIVLFLGLLAGSSAMAYRRTCDKGCQRICVKYGAGPDCLAYCGCDSDAPVPEIDLPAPSCDTTCMRQCTQIMGRDCHKECCDENKSKKFSYKATKPLISEAEIASLPAPSCDLTCMKQCTQVMGRDCHKECCDENKPVFAYKATKPLISEAEVASLPAPSCDVTCMRQCSQLMGHDCHKECCDENKSKKFAYKATKPLVTEADLITISLISGPFCDSTCMKQCSQVMGRDCHKECCDENKNQQVAAQVALPAPSCDTTCMRQCTQVMGRDCHKECCDENKPVFAYKATKPLISEAEVASLPAPSCDVTCMRQCSQLMGHDCHKECCDENKPVFAYKATKPLVSEEDLAKISGLPAPSCDVSCMSACVKVMGADCQKICECEGNSEQTQRMVLLGAAAPASSARPSVSPAPSSFQNLGVILGAAFGIAFVVAAVVVKAVVSRKKTRQVVGLLDTEILEPCAYDSI